VISKRCFISILYLAACVLPATAATDPGDIVRGPVEPVGFEPFEPGDVFIGATLLNDPQDDHAGRGRILQYDADLNLKGVKFLEGTTHLINGLTIAPDGTLWAFDLWAWLTVRITPDGVQLPNRQFAERPLEIVHFANDGVLLFAEGLVADTQPDPYTTRFPVLPGEDTKVGDGDFYLFDTDGTLLKTYDPEVHGGMTGSFGISHSVISADGQSVIYVSETGSRLMRYDIVNGRQLPDVRTHPQGQAPTMYFDLDALAGGELLISLGDRLERVAEDGELLRVYPLEGFGWSMVAASVDDAYAYVGNWFTGQVVKLDLDDGQVTATTRVCVKCMADVDVNWLPGDAQ
jgi:hypothetical protein